MYALEYAGTGAWLAAHPVSIVAKLTSAMRGLDVSYETVRRWVLKFGPVVARRLRKQRPRLSDWWHLDEMVVTTCSRVSTNEVGRPRIRASTLSAGNPTCSAAHARWSDI